MIGGAAVWATLWIAWGSDGCDFDRSPPRPAPRATWRAVEPPQTTKSPSRIDGALPRPLKVDDEKNARASFDEFSDQPNGRFAETVDFPSSHRSWPPEIVAAFNRLELAGRAAVTGQPVESWRFDTVRAGYEGMLTTHRDNPALQAEIRARLADLSRLEAAAEAARKVEAILTRSRQRDQGLARMAQSLAAQERDQSKAYRALGMIQPSSRKTEGRKLYTLIGADGSRRAYLDVPPGIDADSLLARRVGVRGSVRYDEDLGGRLITVRDIEELWGRE